MGGGGAFIATTLCRRRSGSAEKSAAPRRRRRRGSWTASASCRSSCPRRRSPRTPTAPASASSSRSPATHTTPDQSGTQDHIPGYCICNTNIFLRRFSLKKNKCTIFTTENVAVKLNRHQDLLDKQDLRESKPVGSTWGQGQAKRSMLHHGIYSSVVQCRRRPTYLEPLPTSLSVA